MLRKDGQMEGRTNGSVTISLCNFVDEGIISHSDPWSSTLIYLTLYIYYGNNVKIQGHVNISGGVE
jgi:hypothetical protein